jgi:predicted membrane channel-forming protein YqfA (hemolysin III family)
MSRLLLRLLPRLPLVLTVLAVIALLLYGPIAQLAHYHEFADQRSALGLPNLADVLSNAGFALIGLFGLLRLWPMRRQPAISAGWAGYCLFLVSLFLTAIGSSFYHLAPDNARLLWDRLPIALACAGLLVGVRAETQTASGQYCYALLLVIAAVGSVVWWYFTELQGAGDLRPYLLLQGLPLVLIPLWHAIHRAPAADRRSFGMAIFLYVLAKAAELHDHELLETLGWISGHTLKHLLATAAAAVLVNRLVQRVQGGCATG